MKQEKKTYLVEGQLRHNGEFYSPDDEEMNTIDLTDKEARPLLAVGVIADPDQAAVDEGGEGSTAQKGADKAKEAPSDPADRLAAIEGAIGQLEEGNEEHWLADGETPDVKALETVLGWNITAAERNQAFANLSKGSEE